MNDNEKNFLLGETTFLSLTMVIAIVGSVYFFGRLSYKIDANAAQISEIKIEHQKFMSDIVIELKELNRRLGRIEGKLDK